MQVYDDVTKYKVDRRALTANESVIGNSQLLSSVLDVNVTSVVDVNPLPNRRMTASVDAIISGTPSSPNARSLSPFSTRTPYTCTASTAGDGDCDGGADVGSKSRLSRLLGALRGNYISFNAERPRG